MAWQSWAEFLAMGGKGAYVWGSFGVTVLVVAAELWALAQRRRSAREQVRNWRLLQQDDAR